MHTKHATWALALVCALTLSVAYAKGKRGEHDNVAPASNPKKTQTTDTITWWCVDLNRSLEGQGSRGRRARRLPPGKARPRREPVRGPLSPFTWEGKARAGPSPVSPGPDRQVGRGARIALSLALGFAHRRGGSTCTGC